MGLIHNAALSVSRLRWTGVARRLLFPYVT